MKFYILHGWTGTPEINWFPWLKSELEKLGHQVAVPQFPHTDKPQLSEWLPMLNSLLAAETQPVTLIGHSLGGVLMLHYLQQQKAHPKISAAVFVASWGEDDGALKPELVNFFPKPFNFSKIKSSVAKTICFSGTTDPYVGQQLSKNLADQLGADLTWIENGGHLSARYGFTSFPLLLEKITTDL